MFECLQVPPRFHQKDQLKLTAQFRILVVPGGAVSPAVAKAVEIDAGRPVRALVLVFPASCKFNDDE